MHTERRSHRRLAGARAAAALSLIAAVACPVAVRADRVKDLATVEGYRGNALVGVGIVVGLAGTGDDARSPVTRRSLAQLMKHLGITIDEAQLKAKNVAAVVVTAELPPFARAGMQVDVTVSSMGSAKSLQGGTLIATPLKGPDRMTYAIAQGPLSLGGFAVEAATGSTTKKNHSTVARIPNGATIEMDAPGHLPRDHVVLLLDNPDFTTASRIADAIDTAFGEPLARVRDPGAVVVRVGPKWRGRVVHFIAALESVQAEPDVRARVVIDERTGTIVVGEHVALSRAAIAHGGITVRVTERLNPSQPGILSRGGNTVVTPESDISVEEAGGQLVPIGPAGTVGDVAAALNALGVKPRDLVAIFQALAAAGALRAELEVL
ncbi:MAG: flagellar basal body P-ring protein FlgI [Deltaproteobacteria bacterium]|nr:MAG: flagellar basal body P-ring protein FlgI [Deltaproteobacteria bacterium]